MFYDDYDLDYTTSNDLGMDLDEMCEHYTSYNMQDTYDLDEEYGRDAYDYNELAYRHYAWYNTRTHTYLMYNKRTVEITLDVECNEDLDLENIDWNDILGLEGDESVHCHIRELVEY